MLVNIHESCVKNISRKINQNKKKNKKRGDWWFISARPQCFHWKTRKGRISSNTLYQSHWWYLTFLKKKEKEIFFSHRFCQLRISEVCLLNFTLVSCSMQTLSIAFFSTVCQLFSRSFLLMLNLWPNTPKLSFHNIVSATYCNLFNTKSYVYDWMHQESSFAISVFTHNFMRLKLKINYAFFHYDISQPGIPAFYCFSYTFITLIQQH